MVSCHMSLSVFPGTHRTPPNSSGSAATGGALGGSATGGALGGLVTGGASSATGGSTTGGGAFSITPASSRNTSSASATSRSISFSALCLAMRVISLCFFSSEYPFAPSSLAIFRRSLTVSFFLLTCVTSLALMFLATRVTLALRTDSTSLSSAVGGASSKTGTSCLARCLAISLINHFLREPFLILL